MAPPLTMVEQPVDRLGEAAVQLLLGGARAGRAAQRVELDSHLVVGESHWHHRGPAARPPDEPARPGSSLRDTMGTPPAAAAAAVTLR